MLDETKVSTDASPTTANTEIELKLSKLSSMIPAERRLQRLLLGYASEGEMDKSGRILVPTPLRSFAKLSKEVMLVGQLNKFENLGCRYLGTTS